MFVDRRRGLVFPSCVVQRDHPSLAQCLLPYRRRRLGKPVPIHDWAGEEESSPCHKLNHAGENARCAKPCGPDDAREVASLR
jgi:hypothetical protein